MMDKPLFKMFLTKKKLSSFGWTHWGFALIVTIGVGMLFTFIELAKMHNRNFVFFNLRSLNTENFKTVSIKNEEILDNNSPVFVFLNDNVLFGSLKSIVAPMPDNDVLILGKNWKEDFLEKINTYKHKKTIFPSKVYGVIFERHTSYQDHIEDIETAFDLVTIENKIIGKTSEKLSYPAVVLLDAIQQSSQ